MAGVRADAAHRTHGVCILVDFSSITHFEVFGSVYVELKLAQELDFVSFQHFLSL
jgi:hypothetical protein